MDALIPPCLALEGTARFSSEELLSPSGIVIIFALYDNIRLLLKNPKLRAQKETASKALPFASVCVDEKLCDKASRGKAIPSGPHTAHPFCLRASWSDSYNTALHLVIFTSNPAFMTHTRSVGI
ncbi:hypothetical protein AFLA_004323 [Aspergillus flavus NRRL3357]|nr:hypothetical protein AFLA_004323 [Aspergillus flavus NRRL3357]